MQAEIFISWEYLKKFKMLYCNPVSTSIKCGIKLLKFDEGKKKDPTMFKSLIGSLRYLTCIRPDILFAIRVVSHFIETPTSTHMKTIKRILRYLRDIIDLGLFYSPSKDLKLVGYFDIVFMGDCAITWSLKKQSIVTL